MNSVFVMVLLVLASATAHSTPATLVLPETDCAFAGTFTQDKTLSGLSTPVTSNGVFYFHCDAGVIWSTTAPITETLVLTQSGAGWLVKDDSTKPLTSRQSRFLGNLLNSLMGGDTAQIEDQFEISRSDTADAGYQLVPKKRALKRGIKSLSIAFPDQGLDVQNDSQTGPATATRVKIDILDRNDQLTIIASQASINFDSMTQPLEQCNTVPDIAAELCQLLLSDGS